MKPDFSMRGSAIWPVAQAIALGPVPDAITTVELSSMQRAAAPRRVAEPLPTYGGEGLQSGVDLGSNSALLDRMDDL